MLWDDASKKIQIEPLLKAAAPTYPSATDEISDKNLWKQLQNKSQTHYIKTVCNISWILWVCKDFF